MELHGKKKKKECQQFIQLKKKTREKQEKGLRQLISIPGIFLFFFLTKRLVSPRSGRVFS